MLAKRLNRQGVDVPILYSTCSCIASEGSRRQCVLTDLTPLQAYRMLFSYIDDMYISISASTAADDPQTNDSYIDFRPTANDALFEEIFLRRFPTAAMSLTGYYIRFSGPSFDAAAIAGAKALHACCRPDLNSFNAQKRKPTRTRLQSTDLKFAQSGKRRPRITPGGSATLTVDKRARSTSTTTEP